MTAENPRRRPAGTTATELAAKYGISVRHLKRIVAEPRTDYLTRAAERRTRAAELRRRGFTHARIAAELGCTPGAAGALLALARQHGLNTEPESHAAAG